MLKVADLAARADFEAGPLRVSPGRRLIEGPAGSAHLEPIVMKVFLVLLDGAGSVVTRNELFDRAWGGVFVGDDSLNRAIAQVRKIASETAPGLFEIETIPRTGYRVTGEILSQLSPPSESPTTEAAPLSRRTMVVGGLAATAVAGAAGFAVWNRSRDQAQRFDLLIDRAEEALAYDDTSTQAAGLLRQAVALRPESAQAEGLLAYAIAASVDQARRAGSPDATADAKNAAAAALRIDRRNADAQVAQVLLQRSTIDLIATEDRARAILAAAPDNVFAMRLLWNLLTSVGRTRDALGLVQRAISVDPVAAASNFPLAQLLWINGSTAEADRVIDRAIQTWPDHPAVRWARFAIFAFTGRSKAAAGMLDRDDMRPQYFTPRMTEVWRSSLVALDAPNGANVDRAKVANVEAVKSDPKLFSRQALLCLSALGQVDAAFDVAKLAFAYRPVGQGTASKAAGSTAWAFAPFLFVPPTASLRADPRFRGLADGLGLTAYWAKRGIGPDFAIAKG